MYKLYWSIVEKTKLEDEKINKKRVKKIVLFVVLVVVLKYKNFFLEDLNFQW